MLDEKRGLVDEDIQVRGGRAMGGSLIYLPVLLLPSLENGHLEAPTAHMR